MCSVTKEAYAIVLVTDTLKKKKKRQDTLINKNNRIKEVQLGWTACFGSTTFFGSIAPASFQILYSFVVPIPKRFRIDAGDSLPRASTITAIPPIFS